MLFRIFYSISQAVARRKELGEIACSCRVGAITDLTEAYLRGRGIRVLALDFDGVLAPHGYAEPTEVTRAWLDSVLQREQLERIYIYSNKPTRERKHYFQSRYPQVRFLESALKKPYPDALARISAETDVPSAGVLMVDDRLLTGMLASVLAGTSGVLIARPLVDYSHATVAELFFGMLRFLERSAILLLHTMTLPGLKEGGDGDGKQ